MLDNKNLILAIVISVSILIGFQFFYETPKNVQNEQLVSKKNNDSNYTPSAPKEHQSQQKIISKNEIIDLETAKKNSPRIIIESDKVSGSINLNGALFDDLTLLQYRKDISEESENVIFLAPKKTANPYFASFGWIKESYGECINSTPNKSD